MRMFRFAVAALVLMSAVACGGGESSGALGTYSSVNDEGLTFDFKSGGAVTMTVAKANTSASGSYTVDGDKFLVRIEGRQLTFVRDGKCIQEGQNIYGKLCQGGQAGAASNVSTRKPPVVTGAWVASNADGAFQIDFKSSTQLTFTATPAGGGKPSTDTGTFVVEGDRVNVTLPGGMPLILQFVNDAYETTSLGLPLRFTRK